MTTILVDYENVYASNGLKGADKVSVAPKWIILFGVFEIKSVCTNIVFVQCRNRRKRIFRNKEYSLAEYALCQKTYVLMS